MQYPGTSVKSRRLRTMDDLPLDGKKVIVRVDFNVSANSDGSIGDSEDYRIEAALPTIQELQQRRCTVILLTHIGKSTGKPVDIKAIHSRLEYLMRDDVRLLNKLYGSSVESALAGLEPGSVALLPNVRSDDREMTANERFGQELASSADAYINEAFSVSHRAHTSVTVLPRLLMSCAGRRTILEVTELENLQSSPKRPYVAIVSGSKISTKVGMLRRLLTKVDTLCVGGQIANVFIAAMGKWPVRKFDPEEIAAARALLETAGPKLYVPTDVIIGSETGANTQAVGIDAIPEDTEGLWDIGPESARHIINLCATAQTVMWNGPVGRFEVEQYEESTRMIAEALATINAYTVVGGGDTVNALEKFKVTRKYNHVSIGGGAMIAFLQGKRMAGLEPLYS